MTNYRNFVLDKSPVLEKRDQFFLAIAGLTGENGELVDSLKKHLFYGKPLDRAHLVEELGDIRWYFEYLLQVLDITMEEVEAKNIEKLNKRYPTGYNDKAALNRIDKTEASE